LTNRWQRLKHLGGAQVGRLEAPKSIVHRRIVIAAHRVQRPADILNAVQGSVRYAFPNMPRLVVRAQPIALEGELLLQRRGGAPSPRIRSESSLSRMSRTNQPLCRARMVPAFFDRHKGLRRTLPARPRAGATRGRNERSWLEASGTISAGGPQLPRRPGDDIVTADQPQPFKTSNYDIPGSSCLTERSSSSHKPAGFFWGRANQRRERDRSPVEQGENEMNR